eukprot:3451452-Pleurochrysis_carterae.AAC.4
MAVGKEDHKGASRGYRANMASLIASRPQKRAPCSIPVSSDLMAMLRCESSVKLVVTVAVYEATSTSTAKANVVNTNFPALVLGTK